MADDRGILREVWDGRLTVCFTLAQDEIEGEKPESVFVRHFILLFSTIILLIFVVSVKFSYE